MDIALLEKTDNILSLNDSRKFNTISKTFFQDQFFQIRLEFWFIVVSADNYHDASLVDNPADDFKTYGWSGVYGLPRSLWLQDDGTLGIAPVEELKRLRKNEKTWSNLRLADGETKPLEGFTGDCCELELTTDYASAKNFELNVRVSDDEKEKTTIRYDAETKELVFDASESSLEPFNGFKEHVDIERAPFALKENEPLSLRVFVDGAIVEVFANNRQAITRRVYPSMNGTGINIHAQGGMIHCNLSAWEMNGIRTGN